MNRRSVLAAAVLGLAALGGAAILDPPPRVVWNATKSAPPGLWAARPGVPPRVSDWALVRPEPATALWLSERRLLPLGAALVKRVAAGAGQTVCRLDGVILVDGRWAARARRRDSLGRPLPHWGGCRRLAPGEVFLLNPHPDSLDGRYLGMTSARDVLGRARLVWAP